MRTESNEQDPVFDLLSILLSRKWYAIIGFLSVFSISIVGMMLLPPTYEAYTTVYIKSPALPRVEVPDVQEIAGKTFLGNQMRILESRMMLEKVVRTFQLHRRIRAPSFLGKLKDKAYYIFGVTTPLQNPLEETIQGLRDSISVSLARNTNICTIAANSTSSDESALLANTLARTYVEYANDFLLSKKRSAYNYVEKQVEDARQRLAESEGLLDKFREQMMIFSAPVEITIIEQRLPELNKAKVLIQQKIRNLKKQSNRAEDTEHRRREVLESEKQLKEAKSKLKIALVSYKDRHPNIKNLRRKIAQIENRITQVSNRVNENGTDKAVIKNLNMRNEGSKKEEMEKLRVERNHLSNEIENLLKRRGELNRNQLVLEKLARKVKVDQNALSILEAKLENVHLLKTHDSTGETIRIIDRAIPPTSASRKKLFILFAVGTIVAIAFGIGMAFISEYLDDSLKTVEEAENYLNLPVLGIMPKVTRKLR